MLGGKSPNCSRLPYRYAMHSPFFSVQFIISTTSTGRLFLLSVLFSFSSVNCDTVSKGEEVWNRRSPIIAAILFLVIFFCGATADAASPLETVRVATPGKLVDFAALYAGAHLGIYRQEGIDPQFIVMRSGIILQALAA